MLDELHWAKGLFFLALPAYLAAWWYVNQVQSEPYMDEFYHVPQAQMYSDGNFDLDPMITTPPGLYVIGTVFCRVMSGIYRVASSLMFPLYSVKTREEHREFSQANFEELALCRSTAELRLLNVFLSLANFYLVYKILIILNKGRTTSRKKLQRLCMWEAFAINLFPPLFFSSLLFYTDVGALSALLFCLLFNLKGQFSLSTLMAIGAVFFRQTSVVWVGFIAVFGTLWRYYDSTEFGAAANSTVRKTYTGKLYKLGIFSGGFLRFMWRRLGEIIVTLAGYLLILVAFVGFVVHNKGIVLGDKSAHESRFHVPQIFYFGLVFLFSAVSITLEAPSRVARALGPATKHKLRRILLWTAAFAIFSAVSAALVWRFTHEHPYLLADNRHYTFYLWKDVYRRFAHARYFLIPVYFFGLWLVWNTVQAPRGCFLQRLLTAICIAACLIPCPLLEFRYFIVPYVFVRLQRFIVPRKDVSVEGEAKKEDGEVRNAELEEKDGDESGSDSDVEDSETEKMLARISRPAAYFRIFEILALIGVNVATLWVFSKRTFTYADGSTGRIMW